MSEVTMVVPKGADMDSVIDAGLIELTKTIAERVPDADVAGGLLGGRYGYGAVYENDVFMMHPYCWCEQEECPWCRGCNCPGAAFHYFVDGAEVTYTAWMAFYTSKVKRPDFPSDGASKEKRAAFDREWRRADKIADAVNKRRTTRHDPVCDYCTKFNGESEANFRHKASGLEVRWYKYIGRDMKAKIPKGVNPWDVFSECIKSVKP